MRPRPLLLLCALAVPLAACSEPAETQAKPQPGPGASSATPEEAVELAVLMARFEHHAAKLGFAVQGKNPRLASFYLDELEETLEELLEVEEDEGMPIAHPAGVILQPALPPLRSGIESGDWPGAETGYRAVIDACNRCHAATGHEFIQVLPATGPVPFFQRFDAPEPTP